MKVLLLLSLVLLGACSSSDDEAVAPPVMPADPPVAGTGVPTSATLSAAGATSFVRTTSAMGSDSAEPIEVGDVQLASSETEEPSD